ncbi:MAG: cyclic nucleotide-binding domain-containing protein, partial [Clostridiales bacterium]|nr:cyclic nucleotide-binding domain-containing protein [Clostridiales bacterium]
MNFKEYFPIWDKLTPSQQNRLLAVSSKRTFKKGQIIHNGLTDCTGLFLVRSGQLRAYTVSDEGREITIYRLLERDICLFSASCIMRNIQFDITIEAEKDTEAWLIPAETYK